MKKNTNDSNKPPKKEESLYDILLEELLRRIKMGEASASDLNVARQLLKDNGYMGNPEKPDQKVIDLFEELPFEPPSEQTNY